MRILVLLGLLACCLSTSYGQSLPNPTPPETVSVVSETEFNRIQFGNFSDIPGEIIFPNVHDLSIVARGAYQNRVGFVVTVPAQKQLSEVSKNSNGIFLKVTNDNTIPASTTHYIVVSLGTEIDALNDAWQINFEVAGGFLASKGKWVFVKGKPGPTSIPHKKD